MSNKYTDARYPEKINDLINNEGQVSEVGQSIISDSVNKAIEEGDIPVGGSSETKKNQLIVDKIDMSGPTPVAEFDGVKYYHKYEFDLVEIGSNYDGKSRLAMHILNGEDTLVCPAIICNYA